MGLEPVFVSSRQLERGVLRERGFRVLVLPHSIALSPKEGTGIRSFAAHGGTILADGDAGIFDQHGRRMTKPLLADLFRPAPDISKKANALTRGNAIELPARGPHDVMEGALTELLRVRGIEPAYPVRNAAGHAASDVETYVFRNGNVTILALLRDLPADAAANRSDDEPVVVPLPHPSFAYDLRARKNLGRSDRLVLSLGPFAPTIIAFSDEPLPHPSVSGPSRAQRGTTVEFHLVSATAGDVIHVEAMDPAGRPVLAYAGNVRASGGAASFAIPFAVNDLPGLWTIRARDILSGAEARARIEVVSP